MDHRATPKGGALTGGHVCRKLPCPQWASRWNSLSVFLSNSTRHWASSQIFSLVLLLPTPKFLSVMREKHHICIHVSPLLKRIPRKRSKEQEGILHHGVKFSLKLISLVYLEPYPASLSRDSATGNLRAQPLLRFRWTICHKGEKKKTSSGQQWAEMMEWGRGNHCREENIPKHKGPSLGFVKKWSKMAYVVTSPFPECLFLYFISLPLNYGLVLSVIFSMRG